MKKAKQKKLMGIMIIIFQKKLEEMKSAIVGQEKNLNFAMELYNKKITSKKIKTKIIGSLYFFNKLE